MYITVSTKQKSTIQEIGRHAKLYFSFHFAHLRPGEQIILPAKNTETITDDNAIYNIIVHQSRLHL